jgi:seryl-tRNA synthetase
MTRTVTVLLREPATDMAREEILKQLAHLSPSLRKPSITPDGSKLKFNVPAEEAESAKLNAESLCALVQRSLRSLERKIVYRSQAMSDPIFRGTTAPVLGVHSAGPGQIMLEGVPLRLFQYFDAALSELEQQWNPRALLTPTLIPATVLAKCDYFRSFPHSVTIACHLQPEAGVINAFRARHDGKSTLDANALADMSRPETCLSPAVCYHVYHRHEGVTLPAEGAVYNVRGKCFRYEAANMQGMSRLWDFTMRELVFLGSGESVLQQRQQCVEAVGAFLDQLGLAGEIRTASDPFYIAPDMASKTYFQLTAETKYEVSALLPGDERLAVGSLNYHTDFFGRAFEIGIEGSGPAHSVCIGFGLERLVCAFLAQHGAEPEDWPDEVRTAMFKQTKGTLQELLA